jgi:lysophospholipase L1-like esterase
VEQTVAGVRAVVAAVQARVPAVPILLLAILPARHKPDASLRQQIIEANRALMTLAAPGRIMVHDAGSAFLEEDGTIADTVMRDFLHPTAEGYVRLSQAVAPLLAKLVDGSR